MTVRVYSSTDASAPVLTGAVGSLVALLSAVLVDGYGLIPAAGWTKPYTGTNKAVFRSATAGNGSGMYYRFLDDGTVNAGGAARWAGCRGYGAMTDVDTGTDPYPTTTQQNTYGNLLFHKSSTSDATARAWVIIADQFTCHLLIDTASKISTTGYAMMSFGDCYSYKAADAWKGYVAGVHSTSYPYPVFTHHHGYPTANVRYVYMPRSYTQTGTAQHMSTFSDKTKVGVNNSIQYHVGVQSSSPALPCPNPVDGGLYQSRIYLNETTSPYPVRGFFRGLWNSLHNRPLANGDTFSGVGSTAGKSFQCFKVSSTTGSANELNAQINIETSDTWEVSV